MTTSHGPGAAILEGRQALHLTQAELAARAGVSVQTVSRVERGLGVAEESLRSLAAALDIDAADLPCRPTAGTMPERGDTDPDWKDFLGRLAASGERVVAWESADVDRYRERAAATLPEPRPFLSEFGEPRALGLVTSTFGSVAFVVAHVVCRWAFGWHPSVAWMLIGPYSLVCAAVTWGLWARHVAAPVDAAWAAFRDEERGLLSERYVLTDKAAYSVGRDGDRYTWSRVALAGASRRAASPLAFASDLGSIAIEGTDGNRIVLGAPDPNGDVSRGIVDALPLAA